ncbi:MAG: hypothetical protein OQK12_16275, partial [Motiliproteus sp.]|nr:hypothetical protein [Motiliproteus sp.]
MTLFTSTLRRLPVVAAITFAVSLSSATVQAQQPVAQSSGASETFSQADQQMAELQMRINKLSTTLKLIQQKLLAENAELEGQRKVYIAMVDKAVADQGIDANMVRQRLMWISKQTQKGELPQDQVAALSQEFQEKVRQL